MPMQLHNAISGRAILAWASESVRRTRWIRGYVLSSSWPGSFGVLDLAIWIASPFGTRLAEATGETAHPASRAPLPSRRRTRPAESHERAITWPPAAGSELCRRARMPFSSSRGGQWKKTPTSPSTNSHDARRCRVEPSAMPATAPRARLAAWAGTVRGLSPIPRQDIRAELGLERAPGVPRLEPPMSGRQFASTALAAHATARIDRAVSRILGRPLFAPRATSGTPGTTGWQAMIAEPVAVSVIEQPGLGESVRELASGERPADRPAPFTGWDSPIAMPQPGSVASLSETMLAEETDLARTERPTDPSPRPVTKRVTAPFESPAERGERPGAFAPPMFAGGSVANKPSGVAPAPHADHRSFASLSYPRAEEKVALTGPVAAALVGRGAVPTTIDPIDFAEQLRVALIDDARRHGIEV